jgi:predicted amidophosphoribosyltransferase
VAPDPPPPGLPSCWAWGRYTGSLRAGIRAWKDGGRRDLDAALASLLAEAVRAAVEATGWLRDPAGPIVVVTVPSSARAQRIRGDRPLDRVAAGATQHVLTGPAQRAHPPLAGPVVALRHRRAVADQAGLGAARRLANLASSMEVRPTWTQLVAGRRCLVVDDVMTTGSTLVEAARALIEAGSSEVAAAVIAATPRVPHA